MNDTIQDAQLVQDAQPAQDQTAVNVLLELEQTIKTNIAGIDKGKHELRKQREMLESVLLNDETYRKHNDLAKEAAKVKGKTKKQILDLPENRQLAEKVRELSLEIKEMDVALSDYLREYMRMSGATEIETDDGVREIVYIAKLMKKAAKG